jgi:hypothetical protein
MKKMMMTAVLTTIVVAAQAMSFTQARQEALFLSDKMAYELHLTMDQYEAVYEINLDYFLSIRYEEDVFGIYWNRRNTDLRFVLNTWQYRKYITTVDFYQPAMWRRGSWVFSIYTRYDRGNHFRQPPMVYGTYRGGRNRGTISFYEGRTIAKPADRHVGTGRSWNTQPSGQGNTHFSQPNNGRPSGNGYQPGTNNRQNNSNTGTRRLGTSSPNNGQPTGVNRQNTNRAPQQTTTQQSTRPAGTSNSSGHFGGKR